jgi:hypothetical protein
VSGPIDEAIAATEAQVQMMRIPVVIASTGRPAFVDLPTDITEGELAEFSGWLLTQVLAHIRARPAPSPIVVARGLPI